jgi:hypothetical protein
MRWIDTFHSKGKCYEKVVNILNSICDHCVLVIPFAAASLSVRQPAPAGVVQTYPLGKTLPGWDRIFPVFLTLWRKYDAI